MGGLQSAYGFQVGVGSVAAAEVAKDVKDARTRPEYDVVVIPVDRSVHAEAAFEWYCKRIHRPSNVVHVIHCLEVDPPNLPAYAVTGQMYAESVANAKKAASSLTTRYEKRMKDLKINGNVHSEIGRPGEAVINAAEKYNATHIIMGTRGFGIIRRTMLGSISEYVLHHTKVPVTVVPMKSTNWFF